MPLEVATQCMSRWMMCCLGWVPAESNYSPWTRRWGPLAKIDARKGRVVELRYFGGLSVAETAKVLKISPETAKRDWKMAKAWLFGELTRSSGLTNPAVMCVTDRRGTC
jgi:ECF sigma factor